VNLRLLALLPLLTLAACAATPEQPTTEGLVRTPSSQLDQLLVRPNADLPAYGKVLLDAVPVALSASWDQNAYSRPPMYPPYTDAERLRQDMARLMESDLAEAFRRAGYEPVAFAGPGVLRVSAKVNDLFVAAPERVSPWVTRSATRDAGQAKVLLEARDSVTGQLLARVEHFVLGRKTLSAASASDVSTRMAFDTAFRRFADDCVGAFGAARRTAVSSAR
jgi:hypothetical protein